MIPGGAVFETQGDIRDAIGDDADIPGGQRFEIVGSRGFGMDEVAETTLKREAIRKAREARDNVANRGIDVIDHKRL